MKTTTIKIKNKKVLALMKEFCSLQHEMTIGRVKMRMLKNQIAGFVEAMPVCKGLNEDREDCIVYNATKAEFTIIEN